MILCIGSLLMNITDLKVLRGPNYWSDIYSQLIVLTIHYNENIEDQSIDKIEGFSKNLEAILPSLYDTKRDILHKIKKGITISEVIGEIARELQILAGMNCDYANTNSLSDQDSSRIIFCYGVEEAGVFAGETAFRIAKDLAEGKTYTDIQYDIDDLTNLKFRYSAGPTTGYLLYEVKRRRIPYRQLNMGSLLHLGHGINQKKIRTAITDGTSGLGMEIASDKEETKVLLAEGHIPVPKGIVVTSESELRERIGEVKFPIVVKPLNGNHGRGITTDINTLEDAVFGFNLATAVSSDVILEEFIQGDDYRFLIVNYKLTAATKRIPARVTGDGLSTISQLIEKENRNPDRGEGPEYVLTLIKVDKVTDKILQDKKLTLDSILPQGEGLVLKKTANISTGGIAVDVTDSVHPENKFLAERIARMFNLDICGIDIMAKGVDIPIARGTGAVIEVNAGPGLRMHSNPQKGSPRNVAGEIIDMLFPSTNSAFIPIVAVSDFHGASVTTRLVSHLVQQAGFKPGCNTSEGLYIQGHLSYSGNCTGYDNVQEILFDPTIDYAVVQCSDTSILNSGLGFHKCRVCIIAEGNEIAYGTDPPVSEEKVTVKSVLVNSVLTDGYLILNADDHGAYSLAEHAKCKIALFSDSKNSARIQQHCSQGGIAAVIDEEGILIYEGENSFPIIETKSLVFASDENIESAAKYILTCEYWLHPIKRSMKLQEKVNSEKIFTIVLTNSPLTFLP